MRIAALPLAVLILFGILPVPPACAIATDALTAQLQTYPDEITMPSAEYPKALVEVYRQAPALCYAAEGYTITTQGDESRIAIRYRSERNGMVYVVDSLAEAEACIAEAMLLCQDRVQLVLATENESLADWDLEAYFTQLAAEDVLTSTMLARRAWSSWTHPLIDYSCLQIDLTYHMGTGEETYAYKQLAEQLAKARIERSIPAGLTDAQKVLMVHDMLLNNAVYDSRGDAIPYESHTAYGVLQNGVGVCDGYAEAFQLMLQQLDVPCLLVTGTACSDTDDTWVAHAWNLVQLDGAWYHIDCTWDDPVTSTGETMVTHSYFLLDDTAMSARHQWDSANYPAATGNAYTHSQIVATMRAGHQSTWETLAPIALRCTDVARAEYRDKGTPLTHDETSPPSTVATTTTTQAAANQEKPLEPQTESAQDLLYVMVFWGLAAALLLVYGCSRRKAHNNTTE